MTDPALIPAEQLQDEALLAQAVECLTSLGIAASTCPVAEFSGDPLPDWVQPEAGGWLLMMDQGRFGEGMGAAGVVLGYGEGET